MKRTLFWSFLLGIVAVVLAALLFQVSRTPTFARVKAGYKASDRIILDREGKILDEVHGKAQVRRLNWVDLENVPAPFIEALLKAEDGRFYYHPGLDPFTKTITQQLSDWIETSNTRDPSFLQKLNQVSKAVALELAWNKHDILEAYINMAHYRGELQGLSAAAFGLFDRAPSALTRSQAAVLAALVRSPNASVVQVKTRACDLLAALRAREECGLLTLEHLAHLEQGYRFRPYIKMAPQVAKRLAGISNLGSSGLIRSTLDREIQWAAIYALQKQIAALQSQHIRDGAVVVLENASGNVLAYVSDIGGGRKALSSDAAMIMRQAGSTLKPFIYAKALDERVVTAATVLEDSPLAVAVSTGFSRPTKFDRKFRDLVTVRAALASSLDLPAVRALELLGVDVFVQNMGDLGFTKLQRPDFYGPSLALGSADVKLLELANAYRTFANEGLWTPLRFSPDVPHETAPRRVYSPQAAYIIKNILSDREARMATFGSALSTPFWATLKVAIGRDLKDNWAVGFSEKYTVAVWMGNLSGVEIGHVSASQGAALVWQELMSRLHLQQPSNPTPAPADLVQAHEEWFISGTQPDLSEASGPGQMRSHISFPRHDSLIALDSDISRRNHRLLIQIAAPKGDQNVYLNGRRLGRAQPYMNWEPESGRYTLELRDAKGQIVDKVKFEVRGRRFAMAGQNGK